jgi:hypothetical protein
MDAPMSDPYEPNLCIRTAREKWLCGLQGLIGDLKITGFYVDGNDSTVVAGFYLRTNSLFIDLRPEACVFFFGQTRLSYRHSVSPFWFREQGD